MQLYLTYKSTVFSIADVYFFGIPVVYTLGFFGKIIVFCSVSVIISKLLKLDKAYDDMQHHYKA